MYQNEFYETLMFHVRANPNKLNISLFLILKYKCLHLIIKAVKY